MKRVEPECLSRAGTRRSRVGASLLAKGPVRTLKDSTLLKHFLRPLLDLLLGQILLAGGQEPHMPE